MHKKTVFWLVLSLLLLLRIPLSSWLEYFMPATSPWVVPLYEILTYLSIVFLIWWERRDLAVHNLDFWAILIILVFKPLSVILLPLMGIPDHPMALMQLPGIAIFVIALTLAGLILTRKIYIGKPGWRGLAWFVIGALAGTALFAFYGILMIRWFGYPVPQDPGQAAWLAPVYQLGYAAVSEEPLFRGFLWGGLRRAHVREFWIWLIQAVLFTTAHLHLLNTPQPVLFFSLTFINALLFGLFVWRSRTLAASLGMHGFANGSVLAQYWIYSFLFR
jgi:membrane protease YdiL (CAAX protease family)